MTTKRLMVSAGEFVQDNAGEDITVTGTTVADTRFTHATFEWTGGAINSSSNPANFTLTGTAATGWVDPPGAVFNTLTLNDNLTVAAGAKLEVLDGTVTSALHTSILVTGGASLKTGDATNLLVSAASVTKSVKLTGAASKAEFTGTFRSRALEVESGTAKVLGEGKTSTFAGPVGFGGTASVLVTGGALVIENGSTLDTGTRKTCIAGGKLATQAYGTGAQPVANIKGNLLVQYTASEVKISDTAYNPSGVTGHQYGELKVDGNVEWDSGKYIPWVAGGTSSACGEWSSTGTFTIDSGGCVLAPWAAAPVPQNTEYVVMRAEGGFQKQFQTSTGPSYVDPADWGLGTDSGFNTKKWAINKLR